MTHDKQSGAEMLRRQIGFELLSVFKGASTESIDDAVERMIALFATRSLPQAGEGVRAATDSVMGVLHNYVGDGLDSEWERLGIDIHDAIERALPPAGRVEELEMALAQISEARHSTIMQIKMLDRIDAALTGKVHP